MYIEISLLPCLITMVYSRYDLFSCDRLQRVWAFLIIRVYVLIS